MDVICKNCGSMNDYRTEMKANNLVAYCNGCDKYIKNLPYSPPSFHFGRYKGWFVKDIPDLPYLQWARDTVKFSELLRKAVEERISTLRLTHA